MTGLQGKHLLYLASMTNPNTPHTDVILIKFSKSYGLALHNYCYSTGHAPELMAFERLPGGWIGIAMKYFPSAERILESKNLARYGETWLKQINHIVTAFHGQGYVHGDLRPPNFIVNGETLLLVDFDWGGKEMEATFPDAQLHPIIRTNRDERQITKERDDMVSKDTQHQIRLRLKELVPVQQSSQP